MSVELARLPLAHESDVFAARQRAREVAELLGLDNSDEVRVATAVSELARVIINARRTAVIAFGISESRDPELEVVANCDGEFVVDEDASVAVGIGASRRLMDSVTIESAGSVVVRMTKALPARHVGLDDSGIERLRAALESSRVTSPFDELRAQNLELIAAFELISARQEDLLRLNVELEETNQGVMAMYSQLSDELAETNRGVVALYAELDQRGIQLREASEAKSRFLANVSHELRSPLNSILGLARMLEEPESEPLTESQHHQIGLIANSAHRLLLDVNGLLDLARAESGRLNPRVTAVQLDQVVAELRAAMSPLAREGVELRLDLAPGAQITVESDEALLSQLLRNLISNALKFTEEGSVTISARKDASSNLVRVTVADTGIGIADDDLDRVFEEFFQVPNRLQNAAISTGLGLSYSRRVADALGGTLEVSSLVGKGSAFTVTLPLQWVEMPMISPVHSPDGATLEVGTALVVDDEASFRVLVRQMLQGIAARVLEAEDAAGALELMREVNPDIVFLDLRMAGGGGEEVLVRASTDDVLRTIPIAVITSVDLDATALTRLNRAFAFINKSNLTKQKIVEAIGSARMGRS